MLQPFGWRRARDPSGSSAAARCRARPRPWTVSRIDPARTGWSGRQPACQPMGGISQSAPARYGRPSSTDASSGSMLARDGSARGSRRVRSTSSPRSPLEEGSSGLATMTSATRAARCRRSIQPPIRSSATSPASEARRASRSARARSGSPTTRAGSSRSIRPGSRSSRGDAWTSAPTAWSSPPTPSTSPTPTAAACSRPTRGRPESNGSRSCPRDLSIPSSGPARSGQARRRLGDATNDDRVMRIDPRTLRVMQTLRLGGNVPSLTFGLGSVWAAVRTGSLIVRISPAAWNGPRTDPRPEEPPSLPLLVEDDHLIERRRLAASSPIRYGRRRGSRQARRSPARGAAVRSRQER
jgi:hypothetical protein